MKFLLFSFVFFSWIPVYAQQSPPVLQQPYVQRNDPVLALLESLDKNMNHSNIFLGQGNYGEARQQNRRVINDLELLEDLVMPFGERLQRLIEKEKKLTENTRRIDTTQQPALIIQEWEKLLIDQLENRDQTAKAGSILQRQMETIAKSPPSNQKKPMPPFAEIADLLNDAIEVQDSAIESLGNKEQNQAIEHEEEALALLEEALKKWQGEGKQKKENQQQNKQSGQNQEKQDQQTKNSDQQQESPNRDQQKTSQQDQNKSNQNREKMNPKEALREMARLRKEAKDEKKRREMKYGAATVPGRIQVEKDW